MNNSTLDRTQQPKFQIGDTIEHWFAGTGRVVRVWRYLGGRCVGVKWKRGGHGIAYAADCKLVKQ